MIVKYVWYKASGKYYTDGETELHDSAIEHYQKTDNLSALHIALLRPEGKLPGLSVAFTDLALELKIGEETIYEFPAGTFER